MWMRYNVILKSAYMTTFALGNDGRSLYIWWSFRRYMQQSTDDDMICFVEIGFWNLTESDMSPPKKKNGNNFDGGPNESWHWCDWMALKTSNLDFTPRFQHPSELVWSGRAKVSRWRTNVWCSRTNANSMRIAGHSVKLFRTFFF